MWVSWAVGGRQSQFGVLGCPEPSPRGVNLGTEVSPGY
jgi:hypothetical protein